MKKLILILIFVLAAVLRLWNLGGNPPHLTPDEAALGYNAYSLLKTGKDEYGQLLPIIFKSFGDHKPGLYIYTAVPSIALFGLTEFATRLPSAIAGIVALWFVFKIILVISGDQSMLIKSKSKSTGGNQSLAIVASFVLAISPWHIHFSRGAWEVNLALTLTLAGIYFFIRSMNTYKSLLISAAFFGLTLITYQGAKLSVLVVIVVLCLVYSKQILSNLKKSEFRKSILLSAVVGVVISLPVIVSLFTGKAGRLKVFSVFSYRRPIEYIQAQLDQDGEQIGDAVYYVNHTEVYNLARGIFGRWFNHFSGRFLFFEGDWQNPRHSAPYQGMMQLVDIAFLLIGFLAIVKTKHGKLKPFALLWLVLAPLPAALSRDQVHAVRALNMVVPLTLVASMGLVWLIDKISKLGRLRVAGYVFVGTIYVLSFLYFLDAQFIHLPKHNSKYWEYGYKQVVEVVTPIADRYEVVHVRQSFAQPYIYFLFYQKYDPASYQKQANLIESEYGDVGRVEHLDNYCFCPIDWTVNRGDENTLFVADPIRVPPEDSNNSNEFDVIAEIPYLDGKEIAFRVIGVKEREN